MQELIMGLFTSIMIFGVFVLIIGILLIEKENRLHAFQMRENEEDPDTRRLRI